MLEIGDDNEEKYLFKRGRKKGTSGEMYTFEVHNFQERSTRRNRSKRNKNELRTLCVYDGKSVGLERKTKNMWKGIMSCSGSIFCHRHCIAFHHHVKMENPRSELQTRNDLINMLILRHRHSLEVG